MQLKRNLALLSLGYHPVSPFTAPVLLAGPAALATTPPLNYSKGTAKCPGFLLLVLFDATHQIDGRSAYLTECASRFSCQVSTSSSSFGGTPGGLLRGCRFRPSTIFHQFVDSNDELVLISRRKSSHYGSQHPKPLTFQATGLRDSGSKAQKFRPCFAVRLESFATTQLDFHRQGLCTARVDAGVRASGEICT